MRLLGEAPERLTAAVALRPIGHSPATGIRSSVSSTAIS
jgi:hypothetical protein